MKVSLHRTEDSHYYWISFRGARQERHRFTIAVVSAVAGIAASGIVIGAAVAVLYSGKSSLEVLQEQEFRVNKRRFRMVRLLRTPKDVKIARQLSTLQEYQPNDQRIELFHKDYHQAYTDYNDKLAKLEAVERENDPDTSNILSLRNEVHDKGKDADAFEEAKQNVVAAVRAGQVRRTFAWSVFIMFVFGFLAAVSVVAFAWAANPPAVGSSQIVFPAIGVLSLAPDEQAIMSSQLGVECVKQEIRVIILGKTDSTFEVVSVPENGCNAVRFTSGTEGIGTLESNP